MHTHNIKPGDAMPEFSISAQQPDGSTKQISSSELRGRPYVLFFYPEADTPGCTKESIRFTELAAEFEKYNALVIGASSDTLEKQYAFICKFKLSMPLLSDSGGAYRALLGNPDGGLPAARITYVVDAEGKVRCVVGNPRIDAELHPQAALDCLESL
ncbi:MAG: peroxiredoxin [bacterium]|nr:peroxiredoxin [bacterium]